VEALAAVWDKLPPIVAHLSTMRVIDGVHRLAAAKLIGRKTVPVTFFEGRDNDAFVLAVRLNVSHGLPLSLADRKRAAEGILLSHPHWSSRRVVATVGISMDTLAEIRRQLLRDPEAREVRIGRDGKARPADAAEGRRLATQLIAENPDWSLRQIARAAGISPETVRRLRNRLKQAENPPVQEPDPLEGGAVPKQRTGPVRLVPGERQDELPAAVVARLTSDPALRFSVGGRTLLRLLHLQLVGTEEWASLLESLPPHTRATVAQLARSCAELWGEFGTQVRTRLVNSPD
jgi:ParB-like chromosome segregation protein Spo0J